MNRAGLAACLLIVGSLGAQHAKAVGDTRTLNLHHVHTNEDLTITYKKNGQYDEEALKKINWIMRDWRKNESVEMDRQEIDLLWEVYQEVGAKEPIHIICGYRSPATNNMLRGRSKRSGVARHSQHTLGKAIDFHIPGVPLDKLRATAMKIQGGGVGYYPTSGSPFVHLDVGNVRAWPRMTREQLVKLFPDGRTVHVPADGSPLPGYELAKADIERGANHRSVAEPQKRSFLASLFSRDKDAEEVDDASAARETTAAVSRRANSKSEPSKPEPSKPAAAARVQIASTAESVLTAAPVPLPPRRPMYQIASVESRPAPVPRQAAVAQAAPPTKVAPVQLASLSPNQIVGMRGLWDSQDEPAAATIPVAETNALSVSSARRIQTASATRETTASIGPFPAQDRFQDRVPADLALAYAAQADNGGSRTFVRAGDGAPATVTTKGLASIATKPSGIIAQGRLTQANDRLDDPWMRGLVLAPSVQNSLVVTPVGDPDFKALARFMTKPGSSVLMTFSNDPYLGMTSEQFTGSAVVFPATVTFGTSRRTASLQ